MNIKIPYDGYFLGRKNLELELPWITPGATYRLDELLTVVLPWRVENEKLVKTEMRHRVGCRKNKKFKAVEFGSGGSTLFLARRCDKVLSFEHSKEWSKKVTEIMNKREIKNVNLITCDKKEELISYIDKIKVGKFNCALIDNNWKVLGRDEILKKVINKLNRKSIIVLDNYGSEASFRESYNTTIDEFIKKYLDKEWIGEEFNSSFWGGLGTRIFHRNIVKKVNPLIPSSNKIHSAKWISV